VSGYWLAFARTGKPRQVGAPRWLNDTAGRDRTVEFGERISLKADFVKARLNVMIGAWKVLGALRNRK
jgi:carboxylesterase type B